MNDPRARWTSLLLAPTLALAWLVAGPASSARAQNPNVAERATMTRKVDTVVIPGSALNEQVLGTHQTLIRVYACRSGVMVPIVYQIDEKTAEGGWCWTQGTERVKDDDKGQLDENDELVIRIRDAGDRARAGLLLTLPGQSGWCEVELEDPLTKRKAWIYVVSYPYSMRPGRLEKDYVGITLERVDDEKSRCEWQGDGWKFNNYKSPFNAARATFAAFRQDNGKYSPSMLDATVLFAQATFMYFNLERKSDDIRVSLGGYIDGPLRVVAQNRLKVYLALSFWVEAPESYLILWPNRVSMPTNVSNPVNLDENGDSDYRLAWDMSSKAKGWKFYNARNKTPVTIDGKMSPAEKKLDLRYPAWNCVFGPEGAMLSMFVLPKAMVRKTNRLVYIDDATQVLGSESAPLDLEKGAYGANGYYVDLSGLKSGTYSGDYVVWYVPPPFKQGDEVPLLNEYKHPIRARTTAP